MGKEKRKGRMPRGCSEDNSYLWYRKYDFLGNMELDLILYFGGAMGEKFIFSPFLRNGKMSDFDDLYV